MSKNEMKNQGLSYFYNKLELAKNRRDTGLSIASLEYFNRCFAALEVMLHCEIIGVAEYDKLYDLAIDEKRKEV